MLAGLLLATQEAKSASNLILRAGEGERSITSSGRTFELRLAAVLVSINGEEFRLILSGWTYTSRDFALVSIKDNDGNVAVVSKNADAEVTMEHVRKQQSLQKL